MVNAGAGQTVKIDFFGVERLDQRGEPDAGAVGFWLKVRSPTTSSRSPGSSLSRWGPQVAAALSVYMVALLLIGLGLITGVMTRIAAVGGIAWLAIFYLGTAIWPEHNPFPDDHVVRDQPWSG